MEAHTAFDLLVYLERSCGGTDSSTFWTADGAPDLSTAREFAEQMRLQSGVFLNDLISVEQRVNVVEVSLIEAAAEESKVHA